MSKTRTEYRVVGKTPSGPSEIESALTRNRTRAVKDRDEMVGIYRHVRIQSRTVTESDWEDVQDGGRGE